MMSRKIILSSIAMFAALSGCTKNSALPESTTTVVQTRIDTVARSADGLFVLTLHAGAVPPGTRIRIDTRRDLNPDGAFSELYSVYPESVLVNDPGEMRIYMPEGTNVQSYQIAAFDLRGVLREPVEGSQPSRVSSFVRAPFTSFAGANFALVGGGEAPCFNRSCGDACTTCNPLDSTCTGGEGFCDNSGACLPQQSVCLPAEGWDDFAGSGRSFIINQIAISEGSALSPLGALMNDQLRQTLLGGEGLVMLELAGLDDFYVEDDASLTLRMYNVFDADDPFFPANNFKIPEGELTCCEFAIGSRSVVMTSTDAPPLPRSRMAARIEGGELLAEGDAPFAVSPYPLGGWGTRVRQLGFTVAPDLSKLENGWFSGVMRVHELAWLENPYCRSLNPRCPILFGESSMLDLIVSLVAQPDMDLDGDGLETFEDSDGDALIDRCWDGCTGADCTPVLVPAIDPMDLGSCALDPRMADGFSVNMSFAAVRASTTGFRTESYPLELDIFYPIDGVVYGSARSIFFGWPLVTRMLIEVRSANADPDSAPRVIQVLHGGSEEWTEAFNFAIPGVVPGDVLTLRLSDAFGTEALNAVVPEIPAPIADRVGFPTDLYRRVEETWVEGYQHVILSYDADVVGSLITVVNRRTGASFRAVLGVSSTRLLVEAESGDTLELSLCYLDGWCTETVHDSVL